MKTLEQLLQKKRLIRVIGFDDAPFEKDDPKCNVNIAGVVCAGTRFEGMVWGSVQKDSDDATAVLSQLLFSSKFYEQVHLILIDGLAVGGFNLIDLPELSHNLERPCVCVMRKQPDMIAIEKALFNLPNTAKRLSLIEKAGPIQVQEPFYFQAPGENPETIGKILHQLTHTGHVPEALRLAHLIGKAVMMGESGKRA